MAGSVNDGEVELGSLELPESDIDGDTTLTLGLELVKNPSVLEGTLAEFGGFLLRERWLASLQITRHRSLNEDWEVVDDGKEQRGSGGVAGAPPLKTRGSKKFCVAAKEG